MVKIQFHFLAHFQVRSRQRVAWAMTHTDVPEGDPAQMCLVLNDGVKHFAADVGDIYKEPMGVAYTYDNHYWTQVEFTNDHLRPLSQGYPEYCGLPADGQKGLKNFSRFHQKRFAYDAFGLSMLQRTPDGFCLGSNGNDIKNYKMTITRKGSVSWDDAEANEANVAAYLKDNLMVVDGRVYCRIEQPCFLPPIVKGHHDPTHAPRRVFTPYGGFGDLVMDFEAGCMSAETYTGLAEKCSKFLRIADIVFNLPETAEFDTNKRRMRAVFTQLFRYGGWLTKSSQQTRTKHKKKLDTLFQLWVNGGRTLDDRFLDAAAELMLPITESPKIRDAIEAWVDRPVEAPKGNILQASLK